MVGSLLPLADIDEAEQRLGQAKSATESEYFVRIHYHTAGVQFGGEALKIQNDVHDNVPVVHRGISVPCFKIVLNLSMKLMSRVCATVPPHGQQVVVEKSAVAIYHHENEGVRALRGSAVVTRNAMPYTACSRCCGGSIPKLVYVPQVLG